MTRCLHSSVFVPTGLRVLCQYNTRSSGTGELLWTSTRTWSGAHSQVRDDRYGAGPFNATRRGPQYLTNSSNSSRSSGSRAKRVVKRGERARLPLQLM
jgi:hypothetical protein